MVFDIRGDANDFKPGIRDRLRRLGEIKEFDLLAYRVLTREEFLCQRLIHHCDLPLALDITPVQIPPAQKTRSDGGKEVGITKTHLALPLLGVTYPRGFKLSVYASERREVDCGRRRSYAGKRAEDGHQLSNEARLVFCRLIVLPEKNLS